MAWLEVDAKNDLTARVAHKSSSSMTAMWLNVTTLIAMNFMQKLITTTGMNIKSSSPGRVSFVIELLLSHLGIP
jgi:hypothetical protein